MTLSTSKRSSNVTGWNAVRPRVSADTTAALLLWKREMVRLRRQPMRMAMSLVIPLMFLVVFANGLDATGADAAGMRNFRSYLFPGVLLMSIQAPAVAVGISLVWDRQRGVLRQMLAAPIRRSTIVWGLGLAGATIGAMYSLPLMAIAPYADVPYGPHLLLLLAEIALVSLAFTALGLVFAVTIRSMETFQTVVSLSMMPLLFLSGAMFPPGAVTGWMEVAIKLNPITYVVDALRRTLPGTPYGGDPDIGLNLFGWIPPVWLELGGVLLLSVVGLMYAARRFNRSA